MEPLNVGEYRRVALDLLPKNVSDYVAGGSEDEVTVEQNALAFDRWRLMPRILNDVSKRDQSLRVLGHKVSHPVILAPTSPLRLVHPDAEVAVVKAAARSKALAVCSMDAHVPLELTAKDGGLLWFQLYCYGDRQMVADVIKRAEGAGYKALVVTVDAFYPGRRERMIRNNFSLPSHVKFGNLENVPMDGSVRREDGSVKRFSLTWSDLDWLKSITSLPIVLKGVMSEVDAKAAVDHGVSAIVVSNHGGRQIDQVPASLECLPGIVDAVEGRAEVYMDGGVRRGTDVLKAMALGAHAVMIGRAYVWGLAVAGEEGVFRVLEILRHEIDIAMAQLGLSSLQSIDESHIVTNAMYSDEDEFARERA